MDFDIFIEVFNVYTAYMNGFKDGKYNKTEDEADVRARDRIRLLYRNCEDILRFIKTPEEVEESKHKKCKAIIEYVNTDILKELADEYERIEESYKKNT